MKKFKLLIIGGGTAGITMAARMSKHLPQGSIGLIEPSEFHYYQPFWTLIGGGIGKKEQTQKSMQSLIPEGVTWIKDHVASIQAPEKKVTLGSNEQVQFDYLIVAPGLVLNWSAIKGAQESLGRQGVHSIYTYEGAEQTAEALKNFKSGKAIFYMPPVPIKCAGAPQKIMYLADEIFRKNNVRKNIDLQFYSNGAAIFGVQHYQPVLNGVIAKKSITTHYLHRLIEIDGAQKIARFARVDAQGTPTGETVETRFDFLHVVPPQRAPQFLTDSGLAHMEGPQKGWLKLDIHSLQHLDFPYIFGIGDAAGLPNSRTGAAIRMEAPVLEQNLMAAMNDKSLPAKYDGYSSCPIVTSFGKVVLAEFGYDNKLMPTFPIESARERRIYWVLKRWLLPKIYWYGMLKGRM
jgi:sulfide:quinone oxidoreductase